MNDITTRPDGDVDEVVRLRHQIQLDAGRLTWAANAGAKNEGAAALLHRWAAEARTALEGSSHG